MMKTSLLRAGGAWVLGAALLASCGPDSGVEDEATGGTSGDSGGTTGSGSGGQEDCAIGSEGCSCTQGGNCDAGLTCASELCVLVAGGSGGSGAGGGSSGGAPSAGGDAAEGGMAGSGGVVSVGGQSSGGSGGNSGGPDHCLNQNVNHSPGGTAPGAGFTATTTRNGAGYLFYSGYAGGGLLSQTITYTGASFQIEELTGSGSQSDPMLNPMVICGALFVPDLVSPVTCGLPLALGSTTRVDFGARYRHGGEGWDYSTYVDMRLTDDQDGEFWVGVAPRLSESYDLADFEITTDVYVGDDPEPWNVGYTDASIDPWVLFHRPEGEQGREVAGDALDFIEIAADEYGLEGETLQSIIATSRVFYGPITDLELEDFCVEVE